MALRILLVGLGGYGNGYVNAILDHADELGVELAGAVDPAPRGCTRLDEVKARVGQVDDSLDDFYARASADVAVISAPIHLHAPFSITALEHGSHVLCEKPAAAIPADARAMSAAAREHDRVLAIGYQWSFSGTIQTIRRDVADGRFGAPRELRTLVFWPRGLDYYARNDWAGALTTPSGAWVMDSPVNNATAHYLHNSLFILGPDGGAPRSVEAEIHRANTIESFDTAAVRVATASGASVLFYTTHAVPSTVGPVIHYRFDEADLYCEVPGHFRARFRDGSTEDYGSPDATPLEKLGQFVNDLRDGRPTRCSIDDAIPQTLVVEAVHRSSGITTFPPDLVRRTPFGTDELVWVDGLQAGFTQCYALGLLPSEHGGLGWARSGRTVAVGDPAPDYA